MQSWRTESYCSTFVYIEFWLRRGQRFDHIRYSGTDIGIHEKRGVLFRAFFRFGQLQAGHSQPGIQRELQLPVGIAF